MLRLDTITRKLQIVLGGAITTNQLPVVVSYSDKTSTTYTGAAQLATTNNTTAVDICASPAASTVRDVDYLSVNNIDTATATVTIRYNDNATLYTIIKATLAVGDQLVYTHAQGWMVIDSAGNVKQAQTVAQSYGSGSLTITASGGTFTTVSSSYDYIKAGRQVTLWFDVVITNSGTATNNIIVSNIPVPSAALATGQRQLGIARESAVTGVGGVFFLNDNSTTGFIQKYDGTSGITSEYVWDVSITYISAS